MVVVSVHLDWRLEELTWALVGKATVVVVVGYGCVNDYSFTHSYLGMMGGLPWKLLLANFFFGMVPVRCFFFDFWCVLVRGG